MRFGPPPEQPGLSPWRWRGDPWAILSSLALLQLVFAFVPLGVVLFYVCTDRHYAGPLLALFAVAALMLTGGDARYTLARDLVMVGLAAIVTAATVLHPRMSLDEKRWLQWPVSALVIVTVAQLGIDLVRLRPVFAALRARRPRALPRARARR